MNADFTVQQWPNGILTVAGAKKRIPKEFKRPWQAPIPKVNPATCPFHREDERAGAFLTDTDTEGERWFVIDSLFAPEKLHRLIIPDTCWAEEKMRSLGGPEKIRQAVKLAVSKFETENPGDRDKLWGFSIQVGPLAAQNVPHCHYHLYRPNMFDVRGDEIRINDDAFSAHNKWAGMEPLHDPNLVVFEESGFRVLAGGQFTGMLFVTPQVFNPVFDNHIVEPLGQLVDRIVTLMVRKFRSVEGLGPDYKFEFEIRRGILAGGIFVPKINNTGTLEDMAMLDPRRGWNLLWSHEETARYLREG